MARRRDDELPLANTMASPAASASLAPDHTRGISDGETHDASIAQPPRLATDPIVELPLGQSIGERYVVSSVLGRGGMGTVYLARDQQLGRDVAVKLHPAGTGGERLYREALAMAQLAHPNVVTVFEVGDLGDRLFVAMEYVRGSTLRVWATETPRTWREIVDMMLLVGEGLIAAHKAGIVHRDFKPENVLVDTEGRPRVSDFGLARANAAIVSNPPTNATPVPSSQRSGSSRPISVSSSMTETGTVLGTPAYMAPEQYAAGEVDARCDEFAFCIVVWELLFGMRPFAGSTLQAVQQAIERRELRTPPPNEVPVALRKVIERGLSAKPSDRFSDLRELLVAMRAAMIPPRRRVLVPALALGAVLVAGSTAAYVLLSGAGQSEMSCATAGDDLETYLPASLGNQVVARLNQVPGHVGAHARSNIEHFTAAYRSVATAACEAHDQHHEWTDSVFQRSAGCRHDVAVTAAAALRALQEHFDVTSAASTIETLPALKPCGDPIALNGMLDTIGRRDLSEARAVLLVALHRAESGQRDQARAALDRVSDSPIAKQGGLADLIALVRGTLDGESGEVEHSLSELGDAYYRAHADGDRSVELEALGSILDIGGHSERFKELEPWIKLAQSEESLFERTDRLGAARMQATLAHVLGARGDLPHAREQIEHAISILKEGASPLALASADAEYAAILGDANDAKRAIEKYESAIATITDTLGPEDARLARLISGEALTYKDLGDNETATKLGQRALELARAGKGAPDDVANAQLNLGASLLDDDRDDEAQPLIEAARATFENDFGPNSSMVASCDTNLALIESDHGHYDRAIDRLQRAVTAEEKLIGPNTESFAALLYNLSADQQAAGKLNDALATARRCLEIRKAAMPDSDRLAFAYTQVATCEGRLGDREGELRDATAALAVGGTRAEQQAVAWPELEKARALVELHRDPAEAKRLLFGARAIYSQGAKDSPMAKRLAEIDTLLKRLP